MTCRILLCLLALAACSGGDDRLVPAAQIVEDGIPGALTDKPGNAADGERVFASRETGHCVLCHVISTPDTPFQGNLGPDLSAVGARLSEAQLRLRVVDYQIVRPGTVMPSYYRNHDLYQVAEAHADVPILSAQAVEDLVAYLSEQQAD